MNDPPPLPLDGVSQPMPLPLSAGPSSLGEGDGDAAAGEAAGLLIASELYSTAPKMVSMIIPLIWYGSALEAGRRSSK